MQLMLYTKIKNVAEWTRWIIAEKFFHKAQFFKICIILNCLINRVFQTRKMCTVYANI